ncbi:hypothetical protein JTE90_024131 [Oedothorax gibbosus]|uniref:WAP domain-containing protein n=1 Tax=Oedothorax gibbosus TaxID=931172 RepID=A0AAV6TIM4_9ARAC|nr:hypothetical protein JTE90_024131 [Oedothorax gibbosus]
MCFTDFCPSKPNIFCYRSSNQCCSDDDCCYGDICCEEFCGKKCRTPTKQETNGTRSVYSSTCQIDYE